jgi:hypothetical protein
MKATAMILPSMVISRLGKAGAVFGDQIVSGRTSILVHQLPAIDELAMIAEVYSAGSGCSPPD